MELNKERQGELFIFVGAILWGLFPVITILSYNKLSPLVSLAGSTFFATLFFTIVLSVKNKWHELKNTAAFKDIILATLILGILYYLLFFFGLRYTSAGNASIIAITEIFFSFLFFQVWRKVHLPFQHILGAILTVIGALIILYPNMQSLRGGEFLILSAVAIAPLGNYFQQKARKIVSSESIMFIRSLISFFVISLLAIIFKASFSFSDTKSSLLFLLINGVFLFGLTKILWIEGIHKISVTKANAFNNITPLVTLFFAWILLKDIPTLWQVLSFIPIFLGILLLGKPTKQSLD